MMILDRARKHSTNVIIPDVNAWQDIQHNTIFLHVSGCYMWEFCKLEPLLIHWMKKLWSIVRLFCPSILAKCTFTVNFILFLASPTWNITAYTIPKLFLYLCKVFSIFLTLLLFCNTIWYSHLQILNHDHHILCLF